MPETKDGVNHGDMVCGMCSSDLDTIQSNLRPEPLTS